jgi:hypothetical protein
MIMVSDTIAPVYDDKLYRFNYVLEVPRSNNVIQEIIAHKSVPHSKLLKD